MATYTWTVTFEADDDADADSQMNDAALCFGSIVKDNVVQHEEEA